MNDKQLDKITDVLVNGIFRNPELMYPDMPDFSYQGTEYYLTDIIATLHNYLHEAVKGERYNYMFHWANKIGAVCEDDIFSEEKE